MEETLKKIVYAGVGLAAQATEKFESTVDELIAKGKLSDKEGKKIVDDFFKKTEKKKDEFEGKIKSSTDEIFSKFKFAQENELKDLRAKVAKLEKEVSKLTAPAKKPVAKKAPAKKVAPKATATKTATPTATTVKA